MGRKNKKSITKPPSPSTSSYNDVISATSSDQHDTAPPFTPKPKPKPTPTVVAGLPALSSKRRAVTAPNASEKKSKKLKSSGATDSVTPHNEQQLQDDIVILKCLIDYKSQNGIDSLSNLDHFFDFVKPSLKLPYVDKGLIVNKVHQFKTKFCHPNNKKDPTPHQIQVFELSKTIWGENVVDKYLHANGGNHKEKTFEVVVDAKENTNSTGDDGNVDFGFSREDGVMVREVMKLMEGDERNELRNKVNKANLAYFEAYLLRLNVLQVAARKAFDAIMNDKFQLCNIMLC